MKNQKKRSLTVLCLVFIMLLTTNSSTKAQESKISLMPFGGVTFGQQSIDEMIKDSEIESGFGYHAGIGLQFSNFWISATYLKTSHTYRIQNENVTMNFSNVLLAAGFDLVNGKPVTPYIQAIYAFPRFTDKESDGFNGGSTFGFGAGLKFYLSNRVFIGLSGIYGMNDYDYFAVKDVTSVNEFDVGGDYLLLLGSMGFKLNLR